MARVRPALDGSSDRMSNILGGKISKTDRQIRGETDFIQKGGVPQDILFQIEVMWLYWMDTTEGEPNPHLE